MYEKTVTTDDPPVDVEERWYEYNILGGVKYVVQRIEGDVEPQSGEQWFYGTSLHYTTGSQIWMARRERWQYYGSGNDEGHINPDSKERLSAMEYRYDGPIERYLVRPRDPQTLALSSLYAGTWHDYDGGIFANYTIDETPGSLPTYAAHEQSAQVAGIAQYDYAAQAGERQHYAHGNLVGTMEMTTDEGTGSGGTLAGTAVYTAFGERIRATGFDTRYGYAGAWGYEGSTLANDPLTDLGWVHVGYRHYDPASGRFVQRDPMGIRGGANTYEYANSDPSRSIDPDGSDRW